MASSSKVPLWLRWWGLLWGAVTFFWFPIEDTRTVFWGFISACWGIWLAGWIYHQAWFTKKVIKQIWQHTFAGMVAGLGLSVVAMILVLVKAGLHAHGFLDFSFYQLSQLLVWTPLYIVLGGMGGWMKYHFFR